MFCSSIRRYVPFTRLITCRSRCCGLTTATRVNTPPLLLYRLIQGERERERDGPRERETVERDRPRNTSPSFHELKTRAATRLPKSIRNTPAPRIKTPSRHPRHIHVWGMIMMTSIIPQCHRMTSIITSTKPPWKFTDSGRKAYLILPDFITLHPGQGPMLRSRYSSVHFLDAASASGTPNTQQ